jgi:hypothetical protein
MRRPSALLNSGICTNGTMQKNAQDEKTIDARTPSLAGQNSRMILAMLQPPMRRSWKRVFSF